MPSRQPPGDPGRLTISVRPGDPGEPARQRRGGHPWAAPYGADGLGDARHRPVDHACGRLGGHVRGREPRAAGGQDDVVPGGDRVAQGRLDGVAVRHHHAARRPRSPSRRAPRRASGRRGPRRPPRRPGWRRSRRGHASRRAPLIHGRQLRGPDLARRSSPSTRTSVIVVSLSTALTMSTSASAATATQVRASISTPVRSAVRTVAMMSTPSSATARSTVTACTATGCTSGTRSGRPLRRLDARRAGPPRGRRPWAPLRRAAARRRAASRAPARRAGLATVTALAETSTMRACAAGVEVGELGRRRRPAQRHAAPQQPSPGSTRVTSSGTTARRSPRPGRPPGASPGPRRGYDDAAVRSARRGRRGRTAAARRATDQPARPTRRTRGRCSGAARRAARAARAARTPRTTPSSSPGCPAA